MAAAPKPAGPTKYTVVKGDSLWKIAQTQLGDAKRWTEILALNPTLDYPANPRLPNAPKRSYSLKDNPDFIAPERIAEIILFCYKLPQSICIRDLVVMPTTSGY